ncbi:hypothetical protein LSCM1_05724 [Leishmania martiniquensis]|uniref:Uncharacterized protein n=1 Tax=Leishmania martiniquensis TaxID=1580590 RepID=A0A836HDA2_9TRYP|nr:hypothetical protein LSCM1_05724 [Leishmania martiniquensis]
MGPRPRRPYPCRTAASGTVRSGSLFLVYVFVPVEAVAHRHVAGTSALAAFCGGRRGSSTEIYAQ